MPPSSWLRCGAVGPRIQSAEPRAPTIEVTKLKPKPKFPPRLVAVDWVSSLGSSALMGYRHSALAQPIPHRVVGRGPWTRTHGHQKELEREDIGEVMIDRQSERNEQNESGAGAARILYAHRRAEEVAVDFCPNEARRTEPGRCRVGTRELCAYLLLGFWIYSCLRRLWGVRSRGEAVRLAKPLLHVSPQRGVRICSLS